jgi:hypothetical protein
VSAQIGHEDPRFTLKVEATPASEIGTLAILPVPAARRQRSITVVSGHRGFRAIPPDLGTRT